MARPRGDWLLYLGSNLAMLRADLGMSQPQLAKTLGVTDNTVSRWERGTVEPSLARLIELLDLVNAKLKRDRSPSRWSFDLLVGYTSP